ncbi:X-linked retinitis pigmentosa GTPase regulator [Plakobranchus ocellatus]|uniref:X-linked retinitis pigmentosa GTPase regulator n=1 Tax=Plakobranchus ocellatus TaxID=259542 RepID=A0AAV4ABS6_9GAST|nr:X-linked retinitis pigmentosa GTPase regulator [Plakobranchus ocellatus]
MESKGKQCERKEKDGQKVEDLDFYWLRSCFLAFKNAGVIKLGTGQLSNTSQPVRLQLDPRPPSDVSVSSLACGSRHTMVLLSNGRVYAFGNNFYAQLGYDFRKETYKENQTSPGLLSYLVHYHVTQVACGDKHTLFLFRDGTVSAVGHNTRGQIGDGGRQESVVPKPVELDAPAISVACGRDHNLVLTGELTFGD